MIQTHMTISLQWKARIISIHSLTEHILNEHAEVQRAPCPPGKATIHSAHFSSPTPSTQGLDDQCAEKAIVRLIIHLPKETIGTNLVRPYMATCFCHHQKSRLSGHFLSLEFSLHTIWTLPKFFRCVLCNLRGIMVGLGGWKVLSQGSAHLNLLTTLWYVVSSYLFYR